MNALLIHPIRRLDNRAPPGVALRRIRPDDAGAFQDFVRALSPGSRRLRFHGELRELPEATLRAMTCVDQRRHVAFVLTVSQDRAERIVGEARYAVAGDSDAAEFGIALADAFRGRGLAERLLAALIDSSRAAGLRWLVGEVLAGNGRMLAFMRRCGFAVTARGGLAPGVVGVERGVDRPLRVAQPAASWTRIARRQVRRLVAELLPSPCQPDSVFPPF